MPKGFMLGLGQNLLGQGMDMAFKKQAMDLDMKREKNKMEFEKQKFDLLSSIQKAEEKRNKILFTQQQTEIKNQQKAFAEMGKLLEGLFDPETGEVNKPIVQKLMALQGTITGTINNNLLKLFQPEQPTTNKQYKEPGVVFDPSTGQVSEIPKTPGQIAAEKQAEADKLKKEAEEKAEKEQKAHDYKVKKHLDIIKSDWEKWAAAERKAGRDPGQPDTFTMAQQAEKRAIREEQWEKAGRPHMPPPTKKGVGSTEPKGFFGNTLSFGKNLFTNWPWENWASVPATGKKQPASQSKPQPIVDPDEAEYVNLYGGLIGTEKAREEYRAMKKIEKK